MYYTYLINTNNNLYNPKLLCLESNPESEPLINSSCDLILFKFFEGFLPDYNELFISNYAINEDPFNKDKIFEIKFNDYDKAKQKLKQI